MAKTQAMIGFNGGGAFYSQTPKSCLEDLWVNKGVNEVPDQSYSSEARVSSLLEKETEINKKLDFRTQVFENDEVCHSERSEESQSLANIVSKKILKRVQNDKFFGSFCIPQGVRGTQSAFTLAEVLITLGIVGIIAAMTLPMLAENYQRRVVETRLKKFYTTFNQAILRAVDEHGPYDGWGYFVNSSSDQSDLIAANFDLYLRKYLSVVLVREIHYTNGQKGYLYSLSDGSAFSLGTKHNRDISFYPKHAEDCLRKRGQYDIIGVCEFRFIFAPLVHGGDPNAPEWKYIKGKAMEPYLFNWDGTNAGLYSSDYGGAGYGCNVDENGMLCTGLIAYNDWQIPQDYPRKIRW